MIKPGRANFIDRSISRISPKWALSRMQARMRFEVLSGAYHGASRTRDALANWRVSKGDADADTLDDLPTLRERARHLTRNNPIAAAATNTKVTHVVGTGLKLHASIDREHLGLSDEQADDWEATTEREFQLWASNPACDAERGLVFAEHQELAWRSVLNNGDHLVLLANLSRPGALYRLALQHIEGDRVCNEGMKSDTERHAGGVRKDQNGAPIGYDVMLGHPGRRYAKSMKWRTIPAFGAKTGRPITLHLFHKLRPGQSRGVPDIAPVIETIQQIGRYSEAEVDAAVKTALFALMVTSETGDGLAGLNYDNWRETRKDYYKENPLNLKGGSAVAVGLFPDDKVESFDPARPNTAMGPFLASMFQQIGMALEIPYEVLINHFNSSWSASQAALMQLWRFAMGRRAWLARHFCQPVYEAWLMEAVSAGRVAAPGFFADLAIKAAYCGAEWTGDAKGHINEQQQVGAARDRVELGVSTLKRETVSLTGEDWDKVRRQREKERRQFTPEPRSSAGPVAMPADRPEDDDDDEEAHAHG